MDFWRELKFLILYGAAAGIKFGSGGFEECRIYSLSKIKNSAAVVIESS
jgi:hypothetical protein